MAIKGTRKKAASSAGKALRNPKTTARGKRVAASALAQRKAPGSTTSSRVASTAGRILQAGAARKATRSAAASALAQARPRRKAKKAAAKK